VKGYERTLTPSREGYPTNAIALINRVPASGRSTRSEGSAPESDDFDPSLRRANISSSWSKVIHEHEPDRPYTLADVSTDAIMSWSDVERVPF
jgi:hypothetical protein